MNTIYVSGTQVQRKDFLSTEGDEKFFIDDNGNLYADDQCTIFFAKNINEAIKRFPKAVRVDLKDFAEINMICTGNHL